VIGSPTISRFRSDQHTTNTFQSKLHMILVIPVSVRDTTTIHCQTRLNVVRRNARRHMVSDHNCLHSISPHLDPWQKCLTTKSWDPNLHSPSTAISANMGFNISTVHACQGFRTSISPWVITLDARQEKSRGKYERHLPFLMVRSQSYLDSQRVGELGYLWGDVG
jgi:hypothetical protein